MENKEGFTQGKHISGPEVSAPQVHLNADTDHISPSAEHGGKYFPFCFSLN